MADGREGVGLFKRAKRSERRDRGQGTGQVSNLFDDEGWGQGLTKLVYGWRGKEWEVEK